MGNLGYVALTDGRLARTGRPLALATSHGRGWLEFAGYETVPATEDARISNNPRHGQPREDLPLDPLTI
ncbi:MAG: hypothetical protein WCF17_13230 [Terracidiphilus sp.]